MPAFLTAHFWDLANPELWVGAGLVVFLAILAFAGAFRMIGAALDSKASQIQTNLDEAERIRAEAQALLLDINRQRIEAEEQAKAMLAAAKDEAKRLEAEAKVKLEQSIIRRAAIAERKIEAAEAEAAAQVKAAAVDLAAQAAEAVLVARLAASKGDAQADKAISELAGKLQ